MKVEVEVVPIVITKLVSSLQLGVVAVSANTNKVIEEEITSPALYAVPPPLVAEK